MKKIISSITLCIFLFSLLFTMGCAKETPNSPIVQRDDKVVFSFRGKTVTESEFGYYLSLYKGRFAQVYTDFADTDEFYSTEIDGVKMEDYLFDMVIQNVKRSLIAEALYSELKENEIEIIREDIEYYIEALIYERYGNDKTVFTEALADIGITPEQLTEIYVRDEMTYSLLVYLADEETTLGMNDDAIQEYVNENYSRIRHIYVNNKYTYLTDENGDPVYGSDGKQMTTPLTGEALESKNAVIAAIQEAIASGGDFDEIYEAFSEDKYYENGYYLTRNTDFVDEVVDAAFVLEVGEWVGGTSDVGTHFVMRLPMDQSPWEDEKNSDFFSGIKDTVLNKLFGEYLDSFASEVVTDSEALDKFDVKSAKTGHNF
ncbi:MAG: hypothetical protein E7628_07550 [Ruminococcaceae bacterium]|nr:hypothetical protein [Oscillospiraceae bacterium]